MKLTEDFGRDINLAIATSKALQLFLNYLSEHLPKPAVEGEAPVVNMEL